MDNLKLMDNFELNGLNLESKGMVVNVFNVHFLFKTFQILQNYSNYLY